MASHVCVSRLTHTLMCAWRPRAGVPLPCQLDTLDGWEWPSSGGGLDPWDRRRRPCLQSCAVGPQSPRPTLSLVLVSCCRCCLGPHHWFPCDNLGHPPSLLCPALGEAPHPQGPCTRRHLRLLLVATPCFALINLVSQYSDNRSIRGKSVFFSFPECAMQPGSSCPQEGTKINPAHRAGGTSTKGVHAQEAI